MKCYTYINEKRDHPSIFKRIYVLSFGAISEASKCIIVLLENKLQQCVAISYCAFWLARFHLSEDVMIYLYR